MIIAGLGVRARSSCLSVPRGWERQQRFQRRPVLRQREQRGLVDELEHRVALISQKLKHYGAEIHGLPKGPENPSMEGRLVGKFLEKRQKTRK